MNLIEPIRIFSFETGSWFDKPLFKIPPSGTPKARNVWFDYRDALSKMPGTKALLAYANNQFCTNPVYQAWNSSSVNGMERLIIQAVDTTMKLWLLDNSSTTATNIKDNLALNRQCQFTQYKGRIYMVNGVDPLQYWLGETTSWKQYHENKAERFRYIWATGNGGKGRLWLACSQINPGRVVWSNVDFCNLYHYFSSEPPVINFADFPTQKGAAVTAGVPYRNGSVIFKANSCHTFVGDPDVAVEIKDVSLTVGCYSANSVQVWNDVIVFMWQDGIYITGDQSVFASGEDGKLKTQSGVTPVSSEIRDWWRKKVEYPDVSRVREYIWQGKTLSTATLSQCQYNSDAIGNKPGVINFSLIATTTKVVSQESYATGWVAFNTTDTNDYWAQSFKLNVNHTDFSIPDKVLLWLKKTGTMSEVMKLNVYICDNLSDNTPDLDNAYAQGQFVLNGVTSVTGEEITVNMSYWDNPQTLYYGKNGIDQYRWIVLKVEGTDSSNYISAGYATVATNGFMYNADSSTPADQSTLSYYFKQYDRYCENKANVITVEFDASSISDFDHWGNLTVNYDTSGLGYVRTAYLSNVAYTVSDNGSDWDDDVEIGNGGSIAATKKHIRAHIFWRRPSGSNQLRMDSFTLSSITLSYYTQSVNRQIIGSAIHKGRYWLSLRKKIYSVYLSGGAT